MREIQHCYIHEHGKVRDYYIKFEESDFYRVVSFYFRVGKEAAHRFMFYGEPKGMEVPVEKVPERALEIARDDCEFYHRLYKYEIVDYV